MADFDERLLRPDLDDPHGGEFWRWCAREELRVQRCASCGRLRFPPRPRCPWCRAAEHDWASLSGRGRVWSFVVPHPPLLPAYAEMAEGGRLNVVVVEAEDDPTIRFVGNLVTGPEGPLDEIDPATIQIGEPVEVVFQRIAEDVALPRWRRAG